MRRLSKQAALLGIVLSFGAAVVFAAYGQAASDEKYKALLAKLKSGDTSIDFGELRSAYANSSGYDSEPDSDLRKEMRSALQKKDYAKATEAAKKALDEDYLDIDAHQTLYVANRETGQNGAAAFHQSVVRGLIAAILSSGDGKSEGTAYVVNSTWEEYIILQVKGLFPNQQSLLKSKGHSYDVMVGLDPNTKEKVTLYFNIDRPMGALKKVLGAH